MGSMADDSEERDVQQTLLRPVTQRWAGHSPALGSQSSCGQAHLRSDRTQVMRQLDGGGGGRGQSA